DEPFASIDPASRLFLINVLAKLRQQGKLIVVIDHELTDYKGLINRFFIIRDGQLSEADVTTLPEKAPITLLTSCKASSKSAFTLENIAIKQGVKTLLQQEKF